MCSPYCLDFIRKVLTEVDVQGKIIIEVGSRNVNGSARSIVMPFQPAQYIGVDMVAGSDVDVVLPATDLLTAYAPGTFDGVISTEMLEHCQDWGTIIHNMKMLLKPGGWLVITTRSKGFPYHPFPTDYWRYELADMERIFSDMTILALEADPYEPGVFMHAIKPLDFIEAELNGHQLYQVQPY